MNRLPISGPGNSCSCPLGPQPCQKIHRLVCLLLQMSGMSESLRVVSASPLRSLFVFSRRTGPSLTGDAIISYGAGISDPPYDLLPSVEKAPLCRRNLLRPHRGHGKAVLPFRGSLPPCSSAGSKGGWCSFETSMAAAADPRTLLRNARDLPPPASQTALPCGPRSLELPCELLALF
jgi:hypothetical protein